MRVLFSPLNVSTMLGARLMYASVPFTHIEKPLLDIHQQEWLDAVWERILQKRDSQWMSPVSVDTNQDTSEFLECELTREELELYIQVLRSCLKECGGDQVELELHLGDRNEEDVELLVHKLEKTLAAT